MNREENLSALRKCHASWSILAQSSGEKPLRVIPGNGHYIQDNRSLGWYSEAMHTAETLAGMPDASPTVLVYSLYQCLLAKDNQDKNPSANPIERLDAKIFVLGQFVLHELLSDHMDACEYCGFGEPYVL